jgi:beta-lactamase class A
VALARRRYARIYTAPPVGRFKKSVRFRKARPGIIVGAVAALAVAAGGVGTYFLWPKADAPPAIETVKAPTPPLPPLKAGPADLQERLNTLADEYGEPVGIAVAHVTEGWGAVVSGERAFPQQSVSKLWVALTALEAVDQGDLSLETPLLMAPSDRSVFNQPLAHAIGDVGYWTTVATLIRHAIVNSDNSANDRLIREVGIERVNDTLAAKGIQGIRLGADERNLQAMIAGLTWKPEYGEPGFFESVRAQLPREVREAAAQAYINDPADGATPVGIVQALAALKRGELLSPASTEYFLQTLEKVRTGPRRLKGGLPPGWKAGHKTGTGQDVAGTSIGINDVGLLTAPDGQTYAVAVLIPRTRRPNQERLALMQAVSKAVVETWQTETAGKSSAPSA